MKGILFSFYNGDFFRMVVTYDQFGTEGLTSDDLVEAISAEYGTATKPATQVAQPPLFQADDYGQDAICGALGGLGVFVQSFPFRLSACFCIAGLLQAGRRSGSGG